MPAIDVNKAMTKIRSFGYVCGYLHTATFLIGEPPEREVPRQIPVTVYELEKLGACADLPAFEGVLAGIRKLPPEGELLRGGV